MAYKWNGIPDNPEVSGYHWLRSKNVEEEGEWIYYWNVKDGGWSYDDFTVFPKGMAMSAVYLGPVASRKESLVHRRMAYFFAGWTSMLPDWRDKHPMDSFEFAEKICVDLFEQDEKGCRGIFPIGEI